MLKNILILYKISNYELYFLNKKSSLYGKTHPDIKAIKNRFQAAHKAHYKTLDKIEKILTKFKLKYHSLSRGNKIKYSDYDTVITVGGDGTFLEASRMVTNQLILGINSDTARSVGKLCTCKANNFQNILSKIKKHNYKIKSLTRLQIEKNGKIVAHNCLNELLISHSNPAAMSRYVLEIDKHKEEQYSSGLWIATPSGSTGAIHSAGGKIINKHKNLYQFLSRELYNCKVKKYKLKRGILKPSNIIKIKSHMRKGRVYIDGSHLSIPFTYGDRLKISISPYPLDSIIFP